MLLCAPWQGLISASIACKEYACALAPRAAVAVQLTLLSCLRGGAGSRASVHANRDRAAVRAPVASEVKTPFELLGRRAHASRPRPHTSGSRVRCSAVTYY